MDTYVIATNNAHKLHEIRDILENDRRRFVSMKEAGIATDPEENGTTFEENALIKARTALSASGNRYAAIADDSGLAVDALNGAPGVYSARYAGDHGDDAANNALLLKNLAHLPVEQRTARFVCCIALVYPDGREITVRGETEGLIIDDARGDGGFGYDPYFYYQPFGKTFSELTAEEKNAISHRGKAIAKLAERLKTN